MTEPSVRRAHATDLKPLAAALGDRQLLDDRLRRQRQGRGMLFVAWLGNCLAGAVYLWLEEAEEPPITRHLPGVPLIMHLAVRPHLRNQGVGKALVETVEEYLVARGHEQVALAVRTDNADAARLYRRLGYRDWGYGTIVCYAETTLANGLIERVEEPCHVMVKSLAEVPEQAARVVAFR